MYIKKIKQRISVVSMLGFYLIPLSIWSQKPIEKPLSIYYHLPLQLHYAGAQIGVSKMIISNFECGAGIQANWYYRSDYRQNAVSGGVHAYGKYYQNSVFGQLTWFNNRTPYLKELTNTRISVFKNELLIGIGYSQKLNNQYKVECWGNYNLLQKSYSFQPNAFSLWAGICKKVQ